MQKIQFQVNIHAPASKVYDVMLGLSNKTTYEQWTAMFNPTSTYKGSWEQGSKMLFIGVDENGKQGGMVSEIEVLEPAVFVSIRHYGILDGDVELTSGEMVEQWAGSHENYLFREEQGITTVTVEMDIVETYLDYFNSTYPAALNKLKEVAEQ